MTFLNLSRITNSIWIALYFDFMCRMIKNHWDDLVIMIKQNAHKQVCISANLIRLHSQIFWHHTLNVNALQAIKRGSRFSRRTKIAAMRMTPGNSLINSESGNKIMFCQCNPVSMCDDKLQHIFSLMYYWDNPYLQNLRSLWTCDCSMVWTAKLRT